MKKVKISKGLYLNKLSKKDIAALRYAQEICQKFGVMAAKIAKKNKKSKTKKK